MPSSLRDFPFHLDAEPVTSGTMVVRHEGRTLAATEQKDLLEKVRAGEHVELDVEAVTYIQRDAPNRNFIRFKKAILGRLAKSGKGNPFLTDHNQHSVLARGGTITKSSAQRNAAGETEFAQVFHLVKPWAVEGVLDGTIDRFSIGWSPTGPITYAHNGEPLEDWPRYWPGDTIELDGETIVVEWEFSAADLVETSAVNVPAVTGTGITGFRAALSAHLGGTPPIPPEEQRMKKVFKALGLSADAAEESVLAAVEKLEHDRGAAAKLAEDAELKLKAECEAHERTRAQLAEHEQRAAATAATQLDTAIAKLYEEGRLLKVQKGEGRAEPDAAEATYREIHAKLGQKAFDVAAARLPAKVPAGRQAGDEDPTPTLAVGEFSERMVKRLAEMGMTPEQYRKNMERGGQI